MSDSADSAPPLGLKRGVVMLVPYDPRWPDLFQLAAAEIRASCGDAILRIEHMGSTAVPGLSAKPILDILVGVPDFAASLKLVPKLAALDYEFRKDEEIPDRHYFRRPPGGDIRTHHLSLAEPASRYWRVTIGFRDALCADPELASEYAELKRDLAERFPLDRASYIAGKSEFVARVLVRHGIG